MQYNKTKALLVTLFLGLACTACGQKRPLTLPEPAPTNQVKQATTEQATSVGYKE
ncbi:MAG: putative small lipoprotein YifL [Paraglaciecola sp.]|jgi:predicted small lipoprotein YifL